VTGLDGRQMHTRIRGRQALERRIRGLQIAVHRFGRGRSLTAADRQWTARALDALTTLLDQQPGIVNSIDLRLPSKGANQS
jgi:hypothetical protein